MPSRLNNVTCNGVALSDDYSNYVDPSNSYAISWMPTACDYQSFYFSDYGVSTREFLSNNESNYTIYSNQISGDYLWFDIDVANGAKLVAGATPNVSGAYGKGYVIAEYENDYFIDINFKAESTQAPDRSILTAEERAKKFHKEFREYLSQN